VSVADLTSEEPNKPDTALRIGAEIVRAAYREDVTPGLEMLMKNWAQRLRNVHDSHRAAPRTLFGAVITEPMIGRSGFCHEGALDREL
jgi:hypothetical protein